MAKKARKVLVLHHSITGNTAKVAAAIARACGTNAVTLDEAPASFEGYDLVFLGTPVHGGKPSPRTCKFMDGFSYDGPLALFCTWGAPLWGPTSAKRCLAYMEAHTRGKVLGIFSCKGMHQFIRAYKGHPDGRDLEAARVFAREVAGRV